MVYQNKTMKPTLPNRKSSYLLFLCVLPFLIACNALQKDENGGSGEEGTEESSAPPPTRATSVDGFVVRPSSLEQIINSTGNLIAYESVDISPERSGKLESLHFDEAAYVEKGTLLAKINDEELQAQMHRLEVNLELAKKEVARGRELLAIQGISQEELDRLINRVDEINAEQKLVQIQIEKSKIFAPFSGVLGLRQISEGAYITPTTVLVQLKQLNPIKLEFDVPERFLSRVREGQTLQFTTEGSDKQNRARVYAIDTEISSATRTFKVRATARNSNRSLKPGQFARITLVTGTDPNALLVPTDAVIPVLDGKQVYVARKGRAIATSVVSEDRQSARVQIISGLEAGDTVIVSGLLSLTDGNPVVVDRILNPENTTDQ
jgi:membrane fusion protein (multidrug efflux system)